MRTPGRADRRRDPGRQRWFAGLARAVVGVGLMTTVAWGQTPEAPPDEVTPRLLPAPPLEETPAPNEEPRAISPPPVRAPAPAPPPPPTHDPRTLRGAHVIIAIERAVGFAFWRSTLTAAPPPATGAVRISWDRETSSGRLTSVLASSATYGELGEVAAPSLIPRVALDGVLVDRITVGGALGYFSSKGTRNVASVPLTSAPDPSRSGVLLAPRVGYLLALRPDLTLWVRAGITYAATSVEAMDETAALITREVWHLQAALDPALVFSPVPHLGILLNPFADVGIAGRRRVTVVDAQDDHAENHADFRWSGYGLALALCGFL